MRRGDFFDALGNHRFENADVEKEGIYENKDCKKRTLKRTTFENA